MGVPIPSISLTGSTVSRMDSSVLYLPKKFRSLTVDGNPDSKCICLWLDPTVGRFVAMFAYQNYLYL